MRTAREQIAQGTASAALRAAVTALNTTAFQSLPEYDPGPLRPSYYSVMNKSQVPPSGDKHDFLVSTTLIAEAWTSSDQFSSDFADRSTRVTTGLATPYAAWTRRPHRATTASGSSRTSAGRKATTARPARRLATIATAQARVARLPGCARTIATMAQCSCIHPRSTPGADLATTSGTRTASRLVSHGLGTTATTGQAPRCERDSLCQHQSSSDTIRPAWPQRPGID